MFLAYKFSLKITNQKGIMCIDIPVQGRSGSIYVIWTEIDGCLATGGSITRLDRLDLRQAPLSYSTVVQGDWRLVVRMSIWEVVTGSVKNGCQ